MIFLTVGTQLPFERMVRVVDEWAGRSGREVYAQIGPSTYRPQNMQWSEFLSADECRDRIEGASVVVAHAGMGSIITALELGRPIVVMPRRADLGEHRNDHQLATAKWLSSEGRVAAALDGKELEARLDQLTSIVAAVPIARHASPRLISAVRTFIDGKQPVSSMPESRSWLPAFFGRRRADAAAAFEGVGVELVGEIR